MIQRQRADIREYLDEDTPFPERESTETSYKLTPAYRQLFDDVMAFVRKEVDDPELEHRAPPGSLVVGDRAAPLPGLQPGGRRTDPAQPVGAAQPTTPPTPSTPQAEPRVLDTDLDDTTEGEDTALGCGHRRPQAQHRHPAATARNSPRRQPRSKAPQPTPNSSG